MRPHALLVALLISTLLGASAKAEGPDLAALAFLEELPLSVASPHRIVVCHGYGCNFRTEIGFTDRDRREIVRLLAPGQGSPVAERKAVAAAVAWFERRVGPIAGTINRTPRSAGAAGNPHEADCIDETANTTNFLLVLGQLGLLRHHAVAGPASQAAHMAAVLRETKTGYRWVVDPWPHKNGALPDVIRLETWLGGTE